MYRVPGFLADELPVVFELLEVLHSSLDLRGALGGAYPLLQRLVPAEHGALCVSQPDNPMLYDWAVAEMPEGFFRGYEALAPHDFVRAAAFARPNAVVRDTEMPVKRSELDRHPLYRHCRERDMPIEHVMTIMLSPEPDWHGGLTLYRSSRVPFSDRERQILQFLAPFFANAVTNCKRYADVRHWASLLDASLALSGIEVIVFSGSMVELARSDGLQRLLDRCFGPGNRGPGGLPQALWRRLQGLFCGLLPASPPSPWIVPEHGAGLAVSVAPVVRDCRTHWVVMFDEVPAGWRERLTSTEIDVAVRVAQGWDNELVASDLGNTVLTVKTHVYRIFNKLGVSSRAALIARWRARS